MPGDHQGVGRADQEDVRGVDAHPLAGIALGEAFPVLGRVVGGGRLPGGAAGLVVRGEPFAVHGEHAEGIVVPQILLGGQRQGGEVLSGDRAGAQSPP
jgi:hypothetical protein